MTGGTRGSSSAKKCERADMVSSFGDGGSVVMVVVMVGGSGGTVTGNINGHGNGWLVGWLVGETMPRHFLSFLFDIQTKDERNRTKPRIASQYSSSMLTSTTTTITVFSV
ncbi:hypothetical protein HZH66_009350 [Vespula vulgaris]|uniref:Uncharacterized protein n=1 Tax=Vespula vulgaris TaxID=7454 RepID=A0A834MZ92_VESVU|nr:hypothetical protein HZH66_009350 [Vespula vulgaris]